MKQKDSTYKRGILIPVWFRAAVAINLYLKYLWCFPQCQKFASVFPSESVSLFVPWEEANTLAILTEALASPFLGFPSRSLEMSLLLKIKPLFMLFSAVAKDVSVNLHWGSILLFPYFLSWIAKINDKTAALLKVGRTPCQNLFITSLALYH